VAAGFAAESPSGLPAMTPADSRTAAAIPPRSGPPTRRSAAVTARPCRTVVTPVSAVGAVGAVVGDASIPD
jgi:hypothetical protein